MEIDQKQVMQIIKGFNDDKREKRRKLYCDLSNITQKGQNVFIGDSITEFYPIADLLSDFSVINRGIGGDTSEDLLSRLNDILILEPKKIFMLIGTNDIGLSVPQEQTVSNIETICKKIAEKLPNTELYLISVLPVNSEKECIRNSALPRTNDAIDSLNERICGIDGVKFIDAGSKLKDESGKLKEEFTLDGLHLSVKGYVVYSEILKPYLALGEKEA